jgi:VRR-NUC domain
MRKTEESALEEFKQAGRSAMRNGWPDYVLVRSTSEGKLEFMGLEVKCRGDVLSDVQAGMHAVLIAAGITVVVREVDRRTTSECPPKQ